MPKLLGKVLVPDAGDVANAVLFGPDVNLFRSGVDRLRTDDVLEVGTALDLAGPLRAHQTGAFTGYPWLALVLPTATNGGYFEWRRADGTRKAYLGYGTDATLDLVLESNAALNLNQSIPASASAEVNVARVSQSGPTFLANLTYQRAWLFNAPLPYIGDAPGRFISYAATVAIAGPPTAGANMAFSVGAYSLYIIAGNARLDGQLRFGSGSVDDVALYRTLAAHLGLGAGNILDLSVGGGTAAAVGTALGDKIALYTATYGFGLQASRIVAYVGSPSGGFAVRQASGSGAKSSGADAVALLGDSSILLGADVKLYRSAADVLKTDDALEVVGKATLTGGVQIPTGGGAAKVLTSDASGNGTWQSLPLGSGTLLTGTGAPAAGLGADGAMYLDTATGRFYGPKAAGAWPAATHRLMPIAPTYAQLTSG